MSFPKQQRFVRFFEHTRIEDLEKAINSFLAEAEKEEILAIGFHYSTEKDFEGGVEMVKHCCAMMLARQTLTEIITP